MEIETLIILKLNEQEAAALKKLLGEHTYDSKTKMGLTREQCEITSRVWAALPETSEESV
jgi:hypothetical protein